MVTDPAPFPVYAARGPLRPPDEQFEPVAPVAGWMDAALCAQIGPEPFYAEVASEAGRYNTPRTAAARDDLRAQAIATCRRCPVRAECLAYAIANDERYGVWGGVDMQARA